MNITASLQIKNNIYQVVLNYKDIKDYSLDNDILTITFNSLNDENLESVTYTLACSVFDSTDIKKVIFEVKDKIIAVRLNN